MAEGQVSDICVFHVSMRKGIITKTILTMKMKQLLFSMLTLLCCMGAWAQSSDVLSGVFTINASGTTVQFSKGNLQYINGNWQFAEHQYDYIGDNQSDNNKDLFAFNGYSTPDVSWFNMSHAQWKYLLATRSVTNSLYAGARYTMATLDGTYKGLIIFPDDYTHPDGTDFVAGTYNGRSDFTATVSLEGWALMEAAGCVFLPAAGYKSYASGFGGFGEAVDINTTTSYDDNFFYTPVFKSDNLNYDDKSYKQSLIPVRLAQLKTGLQQDADGYYLIGTVQDWKNFAAIVNNEINTAANARMIADIDLGDDQTYISPTWHGEFSSQHYHGTFDGQGHTLTVHYNSSNKWHTPFSQTSGATIKNLHVAGTIKSTSSEASHMSGLVSNSAGSDVIQNIWVSADITGGSHSWIECGAFVGCNNCGNTTITDCLFTGSITTTGGNNGCFAGFNQGYQNSTITTNNCLSTGSFNFTSGTVSRGTINNSYVKSYPNSIPTGMQLTDAQLTDGTIAYKLQAGRTDMVWGQRIGTDPEPLLTNNESYRVYRSINGGYTNDPTLAYEGLQQDADDNYYLIGSLFDWQEFADLVKTTPTANAKMTADINLGDDQTMIGSESTPYQGLFDGQGHTLTVAYSVTSSSSQHVAPFIKIKNATIQNLHVSGSITTAGMRPASITSYVSGTCYVRNCWSDVAITSSYNADICAGGLVTRIDTDQTLHMDDCKFSGSITLSNNSGYRAGGLIGWTQNNGIAKVTNCLFAPSALSTIKSSDDNKMLVSGYQGKVTITNCYYNTVGASSNWVVQGTAATDAELSDGTTTTALNNGRSEVIWVQDVLTNQPQLAIFANKYTVPSSGIGTFSAKAKFAVPEGLTAHYCKTYNSEAGTVSVANIDGAVPANTGVLLRGTPGETYTLTGTNSEAATVTDNALVAVTTETTIQQTVDINEVNYTNFGLSGGVFKKVNSNGGTVKANRAYLHILKSSLPTEAKSIALAWDGETTGIANLNVDANDNFDANAPMYNLAGQRVGKSYKGIVVVNGKKVLIK